MSILAFKAWKLIKEMALTLNGKEAEINSASNLNNISDLAYLHLIGDSKVICQTLLHPNNWRDTCYD